MVCGLKQLAFHTKDAYQIACHFNGVKGPPLSTAQNRSTIMAKLYPLYPAVLGQIVGGGEGPEGKEEEKGERREEKEGGWREGERRGRGGEKRRWEEQRSK